MIISQNHPIANPHGGVKPSGLFIMDFDGTLLRSDRTVADVDLDALRQLGERGVVRAIATGRSLFSFQRACISNLPLDFVIFSMGAGILQYARGEIVRHTSLESHEVERACEVLKACRLDFMIHRAIPDNHMFAYFRSGRKNDDFERRLKLYNQYAEPLTDIFTGFNLATQLLAVVPAGNGRFALAKIRDELPDFSVIQTTSPLDGISTWIEIFPKSVSKSLTAAWLAGQLQIEKQRIVSVGNDYNDLDLLEWTPTSFVVDNAPADLKARFTSVTSNNNGGVAEAAGRWMERLFS
ncbi:MAG: HAD family hydrolase [Desulfobacterales bacterium]|jgi:Cof subfamily protein (haloacid dehalogenase superfamily)